MGKKVVRYEHHGREVSVFEADKGQHRDHCLCYACRLFAPGEDTNCPRAKAIFENCKALGMVTPVWECPAYE